MTPTTGAPTVEQAASGVFAGLDFPARKHELVRRAELADVPAAILDAIGRLERESFASRRELVEAIEALA